MFGHNSTGFGWGKKGVAQNLGQTIALNHYNRVTAAGGVLPCGVAALASIINAICKALNLTTEAQFQAAVPNGLDPQWSGYLGGAGSGPTLGNAAQKIFNWAGATGDVSQGTAGSMPLLLAYDGINKHVFIPNVAGNYFSTPHATANNITGDFDFQAEISPYALNVFSSIATKYIFEGQRSFYWRLMDDAKLQIVLRVGGVDTSVVSSAAYPYAVNLKRWVQVTRNSTTGDVKFYTSLDGITYTQLGTTQAGPTGALESANTPLEIGALSAGSFSVFAGKIYRVKLSNSIGGAPVVDFNPNSYNAATSQTNWTSTMGEVWTLNVGTAPTGYKACIVSKTICMYDGINDTLISGVIASRQYYSQHVALNPFNIPNIGGQYYVDGGGAKGLIGATSESLIAFNGSSLSFTGDLEYRLQYCHADFNNTSSNIYLNNSNNVSGSTGTQTTDRCNLGSNGLGAEFANCIISTVISSATIDTPTQRTAYYNIIRGMNENAF